MSDALGDLVQLVVTSVIWHAVSAWVRDQPPAVQLVAVVVAGVLFVALRVRRSRRRAARWGG